MGERIELHVYGGTRVQAVEIEEGDCPHCAFVSEHLNPKAGEVVYVCAGAGNDDIRRVEAVLTIEQITGLVCQRVTSEEVESELRRHCIGSA